MPKRTAPLLDTLSHLGFLAVVLWFFGRMMERVNSQVSEEIRRATVDVTKEVAGAIGGAMGQVVATVSNDVASAVGEAVNDAIRNQMPAAGGRDTGEQLHTEPGAEEGVPWWQERLYGNDGEAFGVSLDPTDDYIPDPVSTDPRDRAVGIDSGDNLIAQIKAMPQTPATFGFGVVGRPQFDGELYE